MPLALTSAGLHVPAAGLWLDAADAPGAVFVSHAHGDHLSRAPEIVCTPETAAIARLRGRAPARVREVPLGMPVPCGDATLVLSSAGHTLGSAMATLVTSDGTLCYTGDFKRRPHPFAPPTIAPRCDVLVTECTFGDPRYRFPPDEEVLGRLLAWIRATLAADGVPVVCAYAFGKAQEVLWHLTRDGLDVQVHGSIASLCRAHEALGRGFPGPGRWTPYHRGTVAGHVLLTTPDSRQHPMVTGIPGARTCVLTGWAMHPAAPFRYRNVDLLLPFSDHADHDALMDMVRESGAGRIYTIHGDPGFADRLRALGYDATHLGAHPQGLPDGIQLGLAL